VSADRAYAELLERLGAVADLYKIQMLLFWDQRVMMPPRGAEARADHLGTITRLLYEGWSDERLGELLEEVRPLEDSVDYDSDEASLIRFARNEHDRTRRVPPALRGEMSRAASLAVPVWEKARRTSDWQLFAPYLERNLALRREYVACFDDADEAYDALLEEFEPGMKTAEVRAVFDTLKPELIRLVGEVRGREVDTSFLAGPFPIDRQRAFERRLLEKLGWTPDAWRYDETVHPFASSISPQDIRITTKHRLDSLDSLFSTTHEFGHGLYEHQVSPSLARTPLARGTSLGMHESQSRMWENLIGRSLPFWRHFYGDLQAAFPERLGGVGLEAFYRAINKVEPSLIRIEADEVTYSLHVILRFELEQELLGGGVDVPDVPDVWAERMHDYLAVEVPDVADGALQDMHWAAGHIGYFSTYALGNVISVQLWERLRRDLPGLDADLERGEFGPLHEWLREQVHRHGRKFTAKELLQRIVGGPLDAAPYVRYLRRKVGEIYDVPEAA
jgi:carboxypeptidase Taq